MYRDKYEIESYISDWHWDSASHLFAQETGRFLFHFLDHLYENVSERTFNQRKGHVWSIGILTCQYGYHKSFSPEIFDAPPFHEIEFDRKMDPSPGVRSAYLTTCKQLAKVVETKEYENELEFDDELGMEMEDFCYGVHLSAKREKEPFDLF